MKDEVLNIYSVIFCQLRCTAHFHRSINRKPNNVVCYPKTSKYVLAKHMMCVQYKWGKPCTFKIRLQIKCELKYKVIIYK